MNRDYQTTLSIAEQAAEWLERLSATNARQGEIFLQWFRQSPVHAREFFLAVRAAERLRHLDPEKMLDVHKFIELAKQNVAQLPASSQARENAAAGRAHRIVGRGKVAALVGFIALLVVATATLRSLSGDSLSTAAGETQTLHLVDGSVLQAGPGTKATFAFTDRERVVRLLHGELIVYVAKDSARPFYVETELAAARAVGTAFAIRQYDAEPVLVTVQEGSVSVSRTPSRANGQERQPPESAIVSAGEQILVTAAAGPLRARHVDLGKELAWATGKLRFTTETIAEAIHEFNLRNKAQISLLSPQAEVRPIRGVFDLTDPRAFASFIAANVNLTLVEDQGNTMLLVPNIATHSQAPSEVRNP
jgi:transmembrane sensor